MATEKRTWNTKLLAARSEYISPESCDSTVSFKMTMEECVEDPTKNTVGGTIQLADCSRKIDWYIDGTKESLDKIDRAINVLRDARKVIVKARIELKKNGAKC